MKTILDYKAIKIEDSPSYLLPRRAFLDNSYTVKDKETVVFDLIADEIAQEFAELAAVDFDERKSYGAVKAHFNIPFESPLATIARVDKPQFLFGQEKQSDFEKDIEEIQSGKKNWQQWIDKLPKKFQDHHWYQMNDWRDKKNKLHQIFFDNDAAVMYLIKKRWPNGVSCPYCDYHKVYEVATHKCDKMNFKFKCGRCYKKFSPLVRTLFHATKAPLVKWFSLMYLLTSNRYHDISIRQLCICIGVTYCAGWRMVKKFKGHTERSLLSTLNHGLFENKERTQTV